MEWFCHPATEVVESHLILLVGEDRENQWHFDDGVMKMLVNMGQGGPNFFTIASSNPWRLMLNHGGPYVSFKKLLTVVNSNIVSLTLKNPRQLRTATWPTLIRGSGHVIEELKHVSMGLKISD